MENKEIKALEVEINTSNKTIKIIKQSHRGHSFADGGNVFEHNGFALKSFNCPSIPRDYESNCFYFRGYYSSLDDEAISYKDIKCCDRWIKDFISAVSAYNDQLGDLSECTPVRIVSSPD
jgi:hypothetical protein